MGFGSLMLPVIFGIQLSPHLSLSTALIYTKNKQKIPHFIYINYIYIILYNILNNKRRSLTFLICENFHSTAEHGLQHRVVPGQHLHCGVIQGAPNIQPHVLVTKTADFEATSFRLGSHSWAKGGG